MRLAVRAADWPLLTGGRYSEVAVRTGLTVLFKFEMNPQQNKTFEIDEWGKYLIIYTLTTNHQNTKIEVAKLEYVFQYK